MSPVRTRNHPPDQAGSAGSPSARPAPGKPPTVQDVARLAGVSVGTVSHVLSNTRYVSPETRERVEWAIAQLGFRPNRVAQALISQRTKTVGMILPDVANPFFSELLRGVEDVLGAADYAVVFGNSDNDSVKERRYISTFRERRVDGMIAVIAADTDAEEMCALGEEVPMVILDRLIPGWTGDSVVGDNRAGMALVVEHLLSLGHRRIALVNGDPRLSSARERGEAFKAAMLSRGVQPVAITEGLFTLQSGYEQTARLLSMHPRPTAICTGNDLLALGALSAIMDAGLKVPQDLSLVGYDDIAYARLAYPPLTTVRQPARDMGATAARLILDRLTGVHGVDRRPVQMVLKTELVVRQSTAPPAAQSHMRSARRVRKRPGPEGEPMDEG